MRTVLLSELLKANGQWHLIKCITYVEIGIELPFFFKWRLIMVSAHWSLEILAANQQIEEMDPRVTSSAFRPWYLCRAMSMAAASLLPAGTKVGP